MILIGMALVITVFSIEVQLRKINKTNERIVEMLQEMKEKG
ncbi:hypothetical protein [Rossellomorea sp. YZS02]|nr:hypothetical protein [Rossellomorea sp. YZS02]MDX8342666.1 hypothetical protein [Rossellomorea sp. YZS02]